MNAGRVALLLSTFALGCDGASTEVSSPSPAKAGAAEPSTASEAKLEAKAAPAVQLPDGADAAGRAIQARHDASKGFSGDFTATDLPGLLWVAANGTEPLLVADALAQVSTLLGEQDATTAAFVEPARQLALSRLSDPSTDVLASALEVLGPNLWSDKVDPAVEAGLQGVITQGTSIERKVRAAENLRHITEDTASAARLLKAALSSQEPAVVVTTLMSVPYLRDGRDALRALVEPFLKDDNSAIVGAALGAYAKYAEKKSDAAMATIRPFVTSKDAYVRSQALIAYAKVAGTDAAKPIAENLDSLDVVGEHRIAYTRDDGSNAKAGDFATIKDMRQAALKAAIVADSTIGISVDFNKPESVDAAVATAKAWAKKHG